MEKYFKIFKDEHKHLHITALPFCVSQKTGRNALHIMALDNHTSVMEWVIKDIKADINLQDNDGNTPLHLAVMHNNKAAARMLLANCASQYIKNKKGEEPADLADRMENQEMMSILTGNQFEDRMKLNKGNSH